MKISNILFLCILWLLSCTTTSDAPPLSGLELLSDSQKMEMTISLNAAIPAYTEEGKGIAKSEWSSYMDVSKFDRDLYIDSAEIIKAVVFKKIKNSPKKETSIPAPLIANKIGHAAPNFSAVDIEGNKIQLSHLKGKVVVLNFWFVACKPCVLEMPDLNALKSKYDGKNVVFVSITFDKEDKVRRFLQSKAFNYKIIPNGSDICKKWGINAYPTNIVIDKEGIISFQEYGFRENIHASLQNEINKLLLAIKVSNR